MDWQLRIYRIKEGELDEWVEEWRRHVAPLRRLHGFHVLGPWIQDRTFVWLLGCSAGDFDAADARYYASDERKQLDPDPARHIEEQQHHMIRIE